MDIAGFHYPIIPINLESKKTMADGINAFRTARNMIIAEFIDLYRAVFPYSKNRIQEDRDKLHEKLDKIIKTKERYYTELEVADSELKIAELAQKILQKYLERIEANNSTDWHASFIEEYKEVDGMADQIFGSKDVTEWKAIIEKDIEHYKKKSDLNVDLAKEQVDNAVELGKQYDQSANLMNKMIVTTVGDLDEVKFLLIMGSFDHIQKALI